MAADDWIHYWDREDSMRGALWRAQSDFFVSQTRRELSFGPEDVLLDIGCGDGHVTASLAAYVREAHGADTSARSVERAGKLYGERADTHFHVLPQDDYLAVDRLPIRGVTRIVCVSVMQYYRSLDEVRALIVNARKLAAPGCLMLAADLLVDYALWKDIAGVLLGGLQSGGFGAKLREVLSGRHKSYAATRAHNPVLTMRRQELESICAEEKLPLRFIPRNLTGNLFRAHALIELRPAAPEA